MSRSPHECAETMAGCMDAMDILNMKGLTVTQTNQLWHHFSKVENSNDPVADLIEIYRLAEYNNPIFEACLRSDVKKSGSFGRYIQQTGAKDYHSLFFILFDPEAFKTFRNA